MATLVAVAAVLMLLLGTVAAAPGVGTAQQHISASPHAAPTLNLEVFTLSQLKVCHALHMQKRGKEAVQVQMHATPSTDAGNMPTCACHRL